MCLSILLETYKENFRGFSNGYPGSDGYILNPYEKKKKNWELVHVTIHEQRVSLTILLRNYCCLRVE